MAGPGIVAGRRRLTATGSVIQEATDLVECHDCDKQDEAPDRAQRILGSSTRHGTCGRRDVDEFFTIMV
jgi:hypothetical protein